MKVLILHCGRNRENSELKWHLNVMKTKMKEAPPRVSLFFFLQILNKSP